MVGGQKHSVATSHSVGATRGPRPCVIGSLSVSIPGLFTHHCPLVTVLYLRHITCAPDRGGGLCNCCSSLCTLPSAS